MTVQTDPITLEVVENRLDSIVREMSNITQRTARSAVVHSGKDFSCAIFDANAQLLAIGSSLPIHILPMLVALQKTVAQYEDDIAPGDIFIGNDPHDGGTHLNDVLIFIPMFHRGSHMGFACNRAHWADVGGAVPGSISGSATEIYQEGLRIPPMRLGRSNVPDPDILRFIFANVRIPEDVHGDLLAQLASCRVAEQRVGSLVDSYGVDLVKSTTDQILDIAEQRMRARIAALPDGRMSHEIYLDNDGTDPDPVRIRSTVTVTGDSLVVDYTGSADQRAGCINTGYAASSGMAFMGVKAALDPKGPINSGTLRAIEVIAPEGSCLNSRPPAACGGLAELGVAVVATMVAMSGLVPEQVSAEEGASANHQNFDGTDARPGRGRYVFYDALSGGGGARAGKDGLDFVRTIRSGNFTMMSTEVLENVFPLVFERQELRPDSGGPGRFRGGLGMTRDYRVLNDGVISVLGDHALLPPAGLEAGQRGAPTRWEVVRGGQASPVSAEFRSKGAASVRSGDVVRVGTPGGGGWGDPLERDPAAVLRDVIDGKVSRDKAFEQYGVVTTSDPATVDESATVSERNRLRAGRSCTPLERGGEPQFVRGMRTASAAPGTWAEDTVVEVFVPTRPQPLTVRVSIDPSVAQGAVRLDAEAWSDLRLTDGPAAEGLTRAVEDTWP
jgi:N-methylhydantoinase B